MGRTLSEFIASLPKEQQLRIEKRFQQLKREVERLGSAALEPQPRRRGASPAAKSRRRGANGKGKRSPAAR
jgi:hypothetical protein